MNKRCRQVEWNGEVRSIAGWARHLKTTRDKIRTRLRLGIRLDADMIDGVHRPIKTAQAMTPSRRASRARRLLGPKYTVEVHGRDGADWLSVSWK